MNKHADVGKGWVGQNQEVSESVASEDRWTLKRLGGTKGVFMDFL